MKGLASLGLTASFIALGACGGGGATGTPGAGGAGGDGGDEGGAGPSSTTVSTGGSGGATSTGGSGGAGAGLPVVGYILAGQIVSPAQTYAGEVHVVGTKIACAAPGTTCSENSPGVPVVNTGGVIAPGLIDTHNHILFDVFDNDDWVPTLPTSCASATDCAASKYCGPGKCACVDNTCKYLDHTQWPKEAEYALMLDYKQCLEDASQGKPIWCPLSLDGDGDLKCEMDKWGELKGLIAGTTSIVGLPGNSSACFGSLSRSIDVAQNDLDGDKVQTSALFPPNPSSANGACDNMSASKTDAYLIHVGEGVNALAFGEFEKLFTLTEPDGCLYVPQTTITHGTAFTAAEFATMAKAGMKLTWSPASNLALYGATTDIPAALAAGVLVSLAPDWSMGGSQNLLDELKVARTWSNAHFGGVLSDQDLVEMVTINAATVLGLANTLGRVEAGYLADLVVLGSGSADPYRQIVDATPADIKLVIVNGVPLVGAPEFQQFAPKAPGCETTNLCGASKFMCVAEPSSEHKLGQTFAQIKKALDDGFALLDGIEPLPPGDCTPACKPTEACFARVVHPVVADSKCGGACPAGEQCYQTAMSGDNQFKCQTTNACAPAKTKALSPVAPLLACP